ncbi:MAG: hypothetical protein AB4426_11075 [Xenococcaceae cyanobacterium]
MLTASHPEVKPLSPSSPFTSHTESGSKTPFINLLSFSSPAPYSLLPVAYSLLPVACCLFPDPKFPDPKFPTSLCNLKQEAKI